MVLATRREGTVSLALGICKKMPTRRQARPRVGIVLAAVAGVLVYSV